MRREDTAALQERLRRVVAGLALVSLVACGRGDRGAASDGGGADDAALLRARALLTPSEPLPPRGEALAIAQAVEAAAEREGAGGRASELHLVAATLFERVWRVEGKAQDGAQALDILKSATQGGGSVWGCTAAVRAAELAGDIAHDAEVTYRELYRAERRFVAGAADAGADASSGAAPLLDEGRGACVRRLEEAIASIAAFRPAPRVLEAIDQGLAGEGSLASSLDASAGGAPKVVRIDQLGGKDAARVVIVFDRPARFRVADEAGVAGQPPRTSIELDGADVTRAPRETLVGGIVSRVLAEPSSTGGRVALDLDGRAFRRVFHLLEPYRVIVDVARHAPGARATRDVRRVVLDPGHGGSDPGAIGAAGVREKDVTLAVAQRAAVGLAREGVAVTATREDDRFVSLEERTAIANAAGADLFVSIHCNAAENRTRHGVETYVLDTTRDQIAQRVAARENATSQAANAEIGSILASMRMADQATHSTRLADLLQRTALASLRGEYKEIHDGGVHTAGFYVLVGARMPAVLFESSYVSNPRDEQALATPDYQARLADGIINAVKAYREGR